MTSPARSTPPTLMSPLALSVTPREEPVPSDTATPAELRAENDRLRRKITSLQMRLAAYVHAINRLEHGEKVEASHVTFVPSPGLVGLARALEEHDRAPAVRFVRDVRGNLTDYLEIVSLVPPAGVEPQLRTLPRGMAVILGTED